MLVTCSFFMLFTQNAGADGMPATSEVVIFDQDYTKQSVIPQNVVLGNNLQTYTDATLGYNSSKRAIEYKTVGSQVGSTFVGIEPFVNGNISLSLFVSSNSWRSSTYVTGSTFNLQVQTLWDGGLRVKSIYMTSAVSESYQYFDVPGSVINGAVPTIHVTVSGTAKSLTVYYNDAYKVTTPLASWSVQNLPYDPLTMPTLRIDNEVGTGATWVSALLYGIKETVSGGVVTAVPGNDYLSFGIDAPKVDINSLGTQYMASHGHKGVAWVDVEWMEAQPKQIDYAKALLAQGWELGIHFTTSLSSLSMGEAQLLMKAEYDEVTAIFGVSPTSWCSKYNNDAVEHANYAYTVLGMLWRTGSSGTGYFANIGNLDDNRWSQYWSKISDAQIVYPSFTHNTDQTVADDYSISYSNFVQWVNNYEGKHIIGFNEYYHRIANQVNTKISYLNYVEGQTLKFSVQCNEFQSRLVINFANAETAVVLKNGNALVKGVDYTVADNNRVILYAGSNDVFEIGAQSALGAPENVNAVAGGTQIALSWTAPTSNGGSSVTGYKVYRGTASGSEVLLATVGNVLAYTDAAVTGGQTYYYKIAAVNSVGDGPQSSEASATVPTVPTAPTISSAVAGNGQVAITWTAPTSNGGSSVTGYKVYRGTASGSEVLLATVGNVLTYSDTSVTNGVTYFYKVSAVNAIGTGSQSNEMSAVPKTVPSAPQNLSAASGNAQVVLTWTAPTSNGGSPVTGYKIYRGATAGSETLLTTVGNVLTYTDASVTNGATYYYAIAAVSSVGEGVRSGSVSAAPVAPATAPLAPQNLVAAAGNDQVSLTWTAPTSNGGSAITNYKIYRGTTSGSETLLATVGNVLAYQDNAVTNGQTYYYRISAVNIVGESVMSGEASAKPITTSTAPTLTNAVAGDAQVVLTWTAPGSNGGSAVTGYKVYRGTASGSVTLLATVGNVLTYTDTSVTNGVTYFYKVSAMNGGGEGPLSNEIWAVPATTPSAPQNPAAAASNAKITLTWGAPAGNGGSAIIGYNVYRGTVSGSETLLISLGNVYSYTDQGLLEGATYYYRVTAVSSVGESMMSARVSATVPTVPSAPTIESVVPGNGYVTLTWSAPASNGGSSVTGYKIYRGTASGSETLLATVGNVLAYEDVSVVNGVTYYYRVAAVSSIGEGLLSEEVSTIPAGRTITVTSPATGVTWYAGRTYTITWTASGTGDVRIDLMLGSTVIDTITDSAANVGVFRWSIPGTEPLGQGYHVRVSSAEDESEFADSPGAIQIVGSTLRLTNPTTGSVQVAGSTMIVSWTSSGSISGITVDLVKGGVTILTLDESTANDGTQSFLLPYDLVAGSDYAIRLTDAENEAVSVESGLFAVRLPALSITYPSGGEALIKGSSVSIQWTGDMGMLGRVAITLWLNGEQVSVISSGTANDGEFTWVPNLKMVDGSGYSIRITPVYHKEYYAQSDASFSLRKPTLTVASPSTGASYARSSTMAINWLRDSANIGLIKIELYQNGVLSKVITVGTTNDGSYSWKIPLNTAPGTYQILISSVTDPTISAWSGTFTIR
jgi:fibronectin type 3 domain-containing protein